MKRTYRLIQRTLYAMSETHPLFEYSNQFNLAAETMGEWFFAQVKSTQNEKIEKRRVYGRCNIEKGPLGRLSQDNDNYIDIDVIKFRIETALLLTVQSLGAGVPVLLLLVALDTGNIYFVCLNDIIDKCIVPEGNKFEKQKTTTIHIPVLNMISNSEDSLVPIKFIAKRNKLYSAFAKFAYQEHELDFIYDGMLATLTGYDDDMSPIHTAMHFIDRIKNYDFWTNTNMWPAISHARKQVGRVEMLLQYARNPRRTSNDMLFEQFPEIARWHSKEPGDGAAQVMIGNYIAAEVKSTWRTLKVLNNVYEECCREWFLPTRLAHGVSYSSSMQASSAEHIA